MKEKITQKGQVLPIVLLLLLMGSLVIVPALHLGTTTLKAGQMYENKARQLYAADSGIDYGIWCIQNGNESGTYDINQNSVSVNVSTEQLGSTIYKITSIAQDDTGTTTVNAHISKGIDFDIDDSFPAFEGSINEYETHPGDIYVPGDLSIGDYALLSGDAFVGGNVTLNDHSKLTGNLMCNGTVRIDDGCIITGIICAPNIVLFDTAFVDNDIFGSVSLHDVSQVSGGIYPLKFCSLCPGGKSRILNYVID